MGNRDPYTVTAEKSQAFYLHFKKTRTSKCSNNVYYSWKVSFHRTYQNGMGAMTCFLKVNIDHWQKITVFELFFKNKKISWNVDMSQQENNLFSWATSNGCFVRSSPCEIVTLILQANENKSLLFWMNFLNTAFSPICKK